MFATRRPLSFQCCEDTLPCFILVPCCPVVVCSVFSGVCSHCHLWFWSISINCERYSVTIALCFLTPHTGDSPWLCFSMDLPLVDIAHKWDHKRYGLCDWPFPLSLKFFEILLSFLGCPLTSYVRDSFIHLGPSIAALNVRLPLATESSERPGGSGP